MMDRRAARVWMPLRVPQELKDELQHEAYNQGVSANALACNLLRYALSAPAKATLSDRLSSMGVRK